MWLRKNIRNCLLFLLLCPKFVTVGLHQRWGQRASESPLRRWRVLVKIRRLWPPRPSSMAIVSLVTLLLVSSSQDVIHRLPATVLEGRDLQPDSRCTEWWHRYQVGVGQVWGQLEAGLYSRRMQELPRWVFLPSWSPVCYTWSGEALELKAKCHEEIWLSIKLVELVFLSKCKKSLKWLEWRKTTIAVDAFCNHRHILDKPTVCDSTGRWGRRPWWQRGWLQLHSGSDPEEPQMYEEDGRGHAHHRLRHLWGKVLSREVYGTV